MSRPRLRRWALGLLVTAALILAWRLTGCSLERFWARRSHMGDLFGKMIPPDWGYLPRILSPLWATLQMSFTGTALGALLALLCAPLCAANLRYPRALRLPLRVLVQILRAFPTLILALTATFLFGLGTFAGAVAITLYTFAILTRLNYEDIENAPAAAYDALCAMGARRAPAFYRGMLPEVASSFLSNALYLLETNVRHSAILGYVGAGGLGLLLNEKTSWRAYDKVGAILLALFLAVCLIEGLSAWLGSLVRGRRRIGKGARRALLLALFALFLLSTASIQPPDFTRGNLQTARSLFGGLLNPELSLFLVPGRDGLAWLLLETACIALLGTALGALLSLPLALLGSGRLMPRPISALFRLLCAAVRSIPFLIWGLIFIRVTGPGAFSGVLTMAVCSVGLLTKRFIGAIDSVDLRPWRALGAMGVSPPRRLRHALLPQLLPALGSAALYRFDVNIREASVLGLVGAGGIGAPLIFAMNQYAWREAGAIALSLVLLVWAVDLLSGKVRRGVGT